MSLQRLHGIFIAVPCRYCSISPDDAWVATEGAIAVPPDAPITPGHITVAPRRHVRAFYGLDVQEMRAVWDLVGEVKLQIAQLLRIANFHVGFEDAAPEDDGHTAVHVVPVSPDAPVDLPAGIEWVRDEAGQG